MRAPLCGAYLQHSSPFRNSDRLDGLAVEAPAMCAEARVQIPAKP